MEVGTIFAYEMQGEENSLHCKNWIPIFAIIFVTIVMPLKSLQETFQVSGIQDWIAAQGRNDKLKAAMTNSRPQ